MSRVFYLSLLLIVYTFAQAQLKPASHKAGALSSADHSKYNSGQTQALVNQLLRDTCLDKKFSVVFYIIQDSTYSLPGNVNSMNQYPLTQAINLLNSTFSRICVSFEHCKTVIIPNYSYNKWSISLGNLILQNWYTENTINIYVPVGISSISPDINEFAYSYPPPPPPPSTVVPVNAIVIQVDKLYSSNTAHFSGADLLHQMGHFFGLPHTFDEINPAGASTVIPGPPTNANSPITSLEYVNRVNLQNCLEHGDGFCDTEADPYPSALPSSSALYSAPQNISSTYGLKDGHGDFYTPPWDNIMSTYSTRCHFSQQQYNYMAYIIMTRRLYLH